jgi:hypothetical protein
MTLSLKTFAIPTLVASALCASSAEADPGKTPDMTRVLEHTAQRAKLLNCMEGAVDTFDDRLSPANVVASAVAWHCEAEGKPENYWIILSQRRSSPDTIDAFYRDLALPFVLRARARRLRN